MVVPLQNGQAMPQIVVAIPVRDEAALIGDCLRALSLQQGQDRPDIVLVVNNSRDGTADLARGLQATLPTRLHVLEHEFAPAEANAGHARRMAMAAAARLADQGGILITTDADACVAPDWLEANLAALRIGADVVCGRAIIDPVDALRIPRHLHEDDAQEVAFGTALDRVGSLLDPDPFDPWPRHTEESGASIAVRRELFLAAGGVPPVASGEDRALVQALRCRDARIRHDPLVCVSVSGRIQGRAADGMADTIRRRLVQQDPAVDEAMEPVADRIRRIGARRLMRLAWQSAGRPTLVAGHLASELRVAQPLLDAWLRLPHFGAAWAAAERTSPVLRRKRVLRAELGTQMAVAGDVLSRLESPGVTGEVLRPERQGEA